MFAKRETEKDSLKFPEQDLVNDKSPYILRGKFQKLSQQDSFN